MCIPYVLAYYLFSILQQRQLPEEEMCSLFSSFNGDNSNSFIRVMDMSRTWKSGRIQFAYINVPLEKFVTTYFNVLFSTDFQIDFSPQHLSFWINFPISAPSPMNTNVWMVEMVYQADAWLWLKKTNSSYKSSSKSYLVS